MGHDDSYFFYADYRDMGNARRLSKKYQQEPSATVAEETNPDRKRATSRMFISDCEVLRCALEVRKRDRDGTLGAMVFRVESNPITGRLIFAGLSLFTEAEIWR